MAATTRTETDSFGAIEVPADSYWGAQTERSIGNFPFGPREQMPAEIVHALGYVKQAAGRPARRPCCRGDPAGRRRSRARRPRRPVSTGHLADRLGHAVEHERQ